MIDFTTKLPEMKSGNELISALSIIPEYDETICQQNQAVRLMALSDLYQIYIPYRSVRGEQRNISLLHADFQKYYKNLPDNNFSELWQIQKVLTDDRINPYEVCMLAMFLNVSVADLVRMKLPEQTQEQRFDEQIYLLHEQGLKYPEIARLLGASYDMVKAIGEQRYKKYHKESNKALKCGIWV